MELEDLGMRLGVARPTQSELVNERKRVSPEMVLRLGRLLGNGAELWLSMQMRYDRWEVEHEPQVLREAEHVEPVMTHT